MALREDILEPIAGDNPSGQDQRYSPVYNQIKEARREEDDIVQGVWAHERKVADHALVIKLASELLAKKSKDLQVAVWLAEALTYREGLKGFCEGVEFCSNLMEQYWETLYPELEDGDAELRGVPIAWLATQIEPALRKVPLLASGVNHLKYKDSLTVPTEEDAGRDPNKAEKRRLAVEDGKLTPEDLGAALNATSAEALDERKAELAQAREAIDRLDGICTERLGEYAPTFEPLRGLMDEIQLALRQLQQRKSEGAKPGASAPEPARQTTYEPAPERQESSAASSSSGSSGGSNWWESYQPSATPAELLEQQEGVETEPEPAAEAAPQPQASTSTSSSWEAAYSQAAAAPSHGVSYGGDSEPRDAEEFAARLSALSAWLRRQDPRSPAPYLLLRGYRWGELRGLGGQLDPEWLEAPSSATRQKIRRLAQQEEWQELLEAAEEAMAQPCGRAWLDLQRYALAGCEGLGEEYAAVSGAIIDATRGLLAEYPQLLEAQLSDDTPAANAQTREALARYGCLPGAGAIQKSAAAVPERNEDALVEDAMRRGRHDLALEMVVRRMSRETTGRGRFQRRVQSARILEAAGRKQAALPLLRELALEIAQRRLEDWEAPSVVVEPLALLYRCMAGMEEFEEERRSIYNQICRLDPVKALDLA
jgi:type VI secretion system protein ImpA